MGETVVIAAGGTGGHIFPAQELARVLQAENSSQYTPHFLAKGLSTNKHFKKEEFSFHDVSSSIVSLSPKTLLKACIHIPKGTLQSLKILKKLRPKLVVGFGSYHTVPVLIAAKILSIPIVLHEANSIPGRVNRLFSPWAEWTGIFFPKAQSLLKGTIKQADIPLKRQFKKDHTVTKEEALHYFGLLSRKKTVLIFGGSQGAQAINASLLNALDLLPDVSSLQVILLTGNDDFSKKASEYFSKRGILASVKSFEPNMYFAWAASDLCISRSGASTIAEQIAYQVPALFIPYPHAQDNHQEINALWMQDSIGAAKVLKEKNASAERICDILDEFLKDSDSYRIMKKKLFDLSKSLVQCDFSQLIIDHLNGDKTC